MFVDFDPVALSLGPISIHWYGIMYLLAFGIFLLLAQQRRKAPHHAYSAEQISDLLFYGAVGVILGGRLGYVLFYDLAGVAANPISLIQIWKGGMSFHGGLLGVMVAMAYFAKKNGRTFFEVADFVAPMVPPGLFVGRLGNFIGGELWGRTTDVPWAMLFPKSVDYYADPEQLRALYEAGQLDAHLRHPSQLYEAGLEGLVMFAILWWYSRKPRPRMAVSGLFILLYGSFRFFVEFFREPDAHLSFILADWVTMGMVLSTPLIIGGIVMMLLAYSRKPPEAEATP